MRPNVIFMHIPKTGGTTLADILERQYPMGRVLKTKVDSLHTVKRYLHRKNVSAVAAHQPFGLHNYFPGKATYITLLRDPIDRVISHYYYALEKPGNPIHRKIQKFSLKEFILTKDKELQYRISNMQTAFAAGKHGPCSIHAADLEVAKENLAHYFSVVGITDRFNESLELMRKVLGWGDITYHVKNKTKSRPLKEEISREVIDLIYEKNQLDIELYEWAKEQLIRKLQAD